MELKKPSFENIRNLNLGQEPVTVKSGLIIETGAANAEKKETETARADVFVAPITILACLR